MIISYCILCVKISASKEQVQIYTGMREDGGGEGKKCNQTIFFRDLH